MVVLIVGAVLLLGYKSINDIMNKSCSVEEATFKNDFNQLLERNSGYGDLYRTPVSVPCGADAICFVNKTISNTAKITNPLIKQAYEAGSTDNIFLIKGANVEPFINRDNLEIKEEFFCVNNTAGKFYLVLEGIGKGIVQISRPSSDSNNGGNNGNPSAT